MADINDLFFFGDDFDAILDILENEDELEEQFIEAASEVQNYEIICTLCQKKCKSKGGLKRHTTAKHKEALRNTEQGKQHSDLTVDIFARIVEKAKEKVSENKIFPENVREEIRTYEYNVNGDTTEFCEIQNIYNHLEKSGNAEKFYSTFYSTVSRNAKRFFDGLSRNSATLLSTKVADCMLAHSKQKTIDSASPTLPKHLSEEEIAGLQYVGGYVLHKLHDKHAKHSQTPESEQAVSILKAGKTDLDMENQKLNSCLNRGGLWAISQNAQSIFERTEHFFRVATSKPNLRSIDFNSIASQSACDVEVVSSFSGMLSNSELKINSKVGKDVLETIIQLYVRVRSFSFAKDIIQRHKMKMKKLKEKALRKDLSRWEKSSETQREP